MVNEQLAMSKTVIAHSNADSAMQDVVTTCMHAIDSMTSCILHFHLTQLEAINPPLNMHCCGYAKCSTQYWLGVGTLSAANLIVGFFNVRTLPGYNSDRQFIFWCPLASTVLSCYHAWERVVTISPGPNSMFFLKLRDTNGGCSKFNLIRVIVIWLSPGFCDVVQCKGCSLPTFLCPTLETLAWHVLLTIPCI